MTKRPIPGVPRSAGEQGRTPFDSAVKENLELIMGQRGNQITPLTDLASTATTAEIISKLNAVIAKQTEILALLQ